MRSILLGLLFAVIVTSCNNNGSSGLSSLFSENDSTATKTKSGVVSANMKELYDKQRLKNAEYFSFTNKTGFTYKGKGGTVLVFEPNVFDCDPNDSVKLNICEFSDLTSIVQANLSTLSNGKPLESNGMVYCKAFSNNKELELKKGKSFKCMFNKPKTKGFKLFEGEETNGLVNWQNPISETAPKTNNVSTIKIAKVSNSKKEALTICTYGTPNDVEGIEAALQFENNPLMHFVTWFSDNYGISYNDLIPYGPNESVLMSFTLTKNGRLAFKEFDAPVNPKIKSKLLGYFERIPKLKGYVNPATGELEDLPVYIGVCPNQQLNEKLESDQVNMTKVNQLIAENDAREKERETEEYRKNKAEEEKFNRQYEERQKDVKVLDEADEFMKIVFRATKMGWINCDRFYNDTRQKADINFAALDDFSTYNIQIVFPSIKSVYSTGSAVVNNIPIEEPVKIIFVGIKNQETYFYNKSMTTARVNEVKIEPSKIREAELATYLEKSLY